MEVDESFIGGKARNMHKNVKARRITGSGPTDKTAVMGILERGDNCKPKDREKLRTQLVNQGLLSELGTTATGRPDVLAALAGTSQKRTQTLALNALSTRLREQRPESFDAERRT